MLDDKKKYPVINGTTFTKRKLSIAMKRSDRSRLQVACFAQKGNIIKVACLSTILKELESMPRQTRLTQAVLNGSEK